MLEKIAKQTFRASEIVNSLLNFSRTSPTEFVELDLNRVIRETASLVEHQFQKAGVSTIWIWPKICRRSAETRASCSRFSSIFSSMPAMQ